jgi:signal peptidase II
MTGFFSRNRLIGLVIAAVIFGLDQWVKWLVVGPLRLVREGDHLDLLEFFDLTRTHNFGVSLGMFTATSLEMRWGLVAITSLIALVVLVWLFRERRFLDILPLGLVLGGALGNIRDRSTFGYVLDYADFHIGEWRPFLIFNIADAAITVGVVIILVRALFLREKPPETAATTAETTAPDPAET